MSRRCCLLICDRKKEPTYPNGRDLWATREEHPWVTAVENTDLRFLIFVFPIHQGRRLTYSVKGIPLMLVYHEKNLAIDLAEFDYRSPSVRSLRMQSSLHNPYVAI